MTAVLTTAYVAVGSNIEPEKHVREALARLWGFVRVDASSVFYRTAPFFPPDRIGEAQPSYINGVWRLKTGMEVRELKFKVLRTIEEGLGRGRWSDKFAPRRIDLDLILFGDAIIDEPDLRIPHPEIWERPFVAAPLLELVPDLILPGTGQRLDSLPVAHETSGMEPLHSLTQELRHVISERKGEEE